MNRRKLLGVAASALLAGCSGGDGDGASDSTPTSSPTVTETEAPPTPTSTPSSTPEATKTETEERTPTTTEQSEARQHIQSARDSIDAAVSAYVETVSTEGPSITDVDAASSEFSRFRIQPEIRTAREALDEARKTASEEEASVITSLSNVVLFVEQAAYVQIHHRNAMAELDDVMKFFYSERYGEISEKVEELNRQLDNAEEHRGNYSRVSPTDFEATSAVSKEEFEEKDRQFTREFRAFGMLAEQMDRLASETERFDVDADAYKAGTYGGLFVDYDFEEINDIVKSAARPDSLAPVIEDLLCILPAMNEGTRLMREADAARNDGNDSIAGLRFDDAAREFRECSLVVDRIEPVSDLLDTS